MRLDWLRIPQELRERPQWAVATLNIKPDGKPDKAPINPATGRYANSVDPSTWVSFDTAINSGYPVIGFMLSKDDPFTIIDLDSKEGLSAEDQARQVKVFETFHSYAERSQSGRGCHIILRGKIGGGFNRDGVEVYDQERFMICTGDVVRQAAVAEGNAYLAQLVKEMQPAGPADLPASEAERLDDDALIAKAYNAANGAKFKELFENRPGPDADWSRLDAALAQMIAFYTRNHEQALRVFARSALYRPETKGKNPEHYHNDYLLRRTFGRAWALERPREANIEIGREMAQRLLAQQEAPASAITCLPEAPLPGLVGDIAAYLEYTAQRQVREVAVGGALAFMAGLVGRHYNVSGTGLNLYLVLVAETGRGKESAAAGIDQIVASAQMPFLHQVRGPGAVASGQALIRALDEQPFMFSIFSEFGHFFRMMTHPKASTVDIRTRAVMLDLFSKSGQYQTLQSTVYSDRDKNTQTVTAPCFTFLGDTTPDVLFGAMDPSQISEGFLGRLTPVIYEGPRPPRNPNAGLAPHPELISRITALATSVANMLHTNAFAQIGTAPDAGAILDAFDKECDARINGGSIAAELWNRAHLKALRIAGVIAVGINHYEPIIDAATAQWAVDFVSLTTQALEARIDTGDYGEGETRHHPAILKALQDWRRLDADKKLKTYRIAKALLPHAELIPYSYFRRRLKMVKAFQDDRRGMVRAIRDAIQDAVDLGVLQRVTDEQLMKVATGGRPLSGEVYTYGPNAD